MEKPLNSLIYDRTKEDIDRKTPKGRWRAEDLNRIEEWTLYLNKQLAKWGYQADYTPPAKSISRTKTFPYSGEMQSFVTPGQTIYTFNVMGACGSRGAGTSSDDTNVGGRGAKMVYARELPGGTVLHVLVGGKGTITNDGIVTEGVTDACAGGGGGMSAVFREIPEITDERYQFEKDGIFLEPLVIAAGGGGGNDSVYRKNFTPGQDGQAANYIHPGNFKSYSRAKYSPTVNTNSNVMGIVQFIAYDAAGTCYTRQLTGQGGFGCGGSSDDNPSRGGGWCSGSGSYNANSWCIEDTAVGTDGVRNAVGRVQISYTDSFWTREDFPIRPEVERIRLNALSLMQGFATLSTWKVLPPAMNRVMNYSWANNLEWDLDQIYQWLEAMVHAFRLREANTIFMEAGGVFNR